MKLFALVHDPTGDRAVSYEGMDQTTVTSLQTFPFDVIDEETYNAFVLAHVPTPLTPAQILAVERAGAIGELLTGTQPLTKLERAILLVILDEVNVIRALLPGPPAPRTITQFKNAVQAKINAGAAD